MTKPKREMIRMIQKTERERERRKKKMLMGWFLVEQVKQTKKNKG